MKTKSLLLTAILTLAGTAGLMAQSSNVYSQNIVGYVNQVVPSGFSIVANQLVNSVDNNVSTIFNGASDQTTVYKFNRFTGGYALLQYFDGAGWFGDDEPGQPGVALKLNPGEAAFVSAPTAFTNTFIGEVKLASTNTALSGFSMLGSVVPRAANLGDIGFPAVDNGTTSTTVYKFNRNTGGYTVDQFFGGGAGWFGDTTSGGTNGPAVAVGEGFFVYSPSSTNWVQTLTVGP